MQNWDHSHFLRVKMKNPPSSRLLFPRTSPVEFPPQITATSAGEEFQRPPDHMAWYTLILRTSPGRNIKMMATHLHVVAWMG